MNDHRINRKKRHPLENIIAITNLVRTFPTSSYASLTRGYHFVNRLPAICFQINFSKNTYIYMYINLLFLKKCDFSKQTAAELIYRRVDAALPLLWMQSFDKNTAFLFVKRSSYRLR